MELINGTLNSNRQTNGMKLCEPLLGTPPFSRLICLLFLIVFVLCLASNVSSVTGLSPFSEGDEFVGELAT